MAYSPTRPFKPQVGGGTRLAVGTSSTRVVYPASLPTQLRISTKATDADCFLEFGDSTVSASAATGYRFAAGAVEFISVPVGTTYIAAITEAGTATLYIHSGEGT